MEMYQDCVCAHVCVHLCGNLLPLLLMLHVKWIHYDKSECYKIAGINLYIHSMGLHYTDVKTLRVNNK
jgi:hypothetical protein